MAKRRRTVSLDSLVTELRELDARRKSLLNELNGAIRSLAGGEALLMPAASSRGRRRASGADVTRTAPRKRRKMSAKARKAISDAQKKRWAKQKAAK
jgi:hypothetical protein